MNEINSLYKFNLDNVIKMTEKAKKEYSIRLIGGIKQQLNELFEKNDFKEINNDEDNKNLLKESFLDNITNVLNQKINYSSDIYDLCLTYFYIKSDIIKILTKTSLEFYIENILESKDFKEELIKRIVQQVDSLQRKVLNIY